MSLRRLMTFSRTNEDLDYPAWLSGDGRRVYAATLPRVKDPTPDQLEMLAAYADATVNLRRVRNDPERARAWRGALIYARNGLGFGGRVFVDLLELLLDWPGGDPDPTSHLKPAWQLPESERPESYLTDPPSY